MARGQGNCNTSRSTPSRGAANFYTPELLRHIALDGGYKLAVWDTRRLDESGKQLLSYRFWRETLSGNSVIEQTLFEGTDFHCSPVEASDSDATLRSLLGYITLRPGDTDEEFFYDYSEAQMEFARGDAEELQMYTFEDEPLAFTDAIEAELAAPAPFLTPKVGETIEEGPWAGFEVVSVYPRSQALEDGVIVDVTDAAREAGYQVPVALTAAAHALVTPTEAEAADGQDHSGRLWDALYMGRGAAKRAASEGEVLFQLYFQLKGRPEVRSGMQLTTLKVSRDATDDGQLALTFSLPDED
jgi:hypothetical protein